MATHKEGRFLLMAESGVYQSGLIPDRSLWVGLNFTDDDIVDALDRARQMLESQAAITDINRRLGIKVDEIPGLVVKVDRVDTNGTDVGRPNYPAFGLDPSVCDYLHLKPENNQLEFRWTLGVFNDQGIGPIPVLFLVTRTGSVTKCVALIWCLAKDIDRDYLGFLLQNRFLENSNERGMEGGLATIYQVGFIVDGLSGGLDILAGSYIIPWKTWETLSMSVYNNAVAKAFVDTAMPWPYPIDMSPDGIFRSPAASSTPSWY